MKAKFKNSNKYYFLKFIVIAIIFIITFLCSVYYFLNNISINLDNEDIINLILNEDNTISFDKINNPEFIFEYAFGSNYSSSEALPVIKEEPVESNLPKIYIYNTHPTEKYSTESFEAFNISPTVVTASYILSEYLNDYNISSVVESASVIDILNANNWSYSKSYLASRLLFENAKNNNSNLEYFIDIHRDSASHEVTTTIVNEQSCARFLFVVGLDHDGYDSNLRLANEINEILNNIHPQFTRGVMEKSGETVDGIYNQDLDPNALLIEVGGQYNNIEEINCSLVFLAEAINIYLEEQNGN